MTLSNSMAATSVARFALWSAASPHAAFFTLLEAEGFQRYGACKKRRGDAPHSKAGFACVTERGRAQ